MSSPEVSRFALGLLARLVDLEGRASRLVERLAACEHEDLGELLAAARGIAEERRDILAALRRERAA